MYLFYGGFTLAGFFVWARARRREAAAEAGVFTPEAPVRF